MNIGIARHHRTRDGKTSVSIMFWGIGIKDHPGRNMRSRFSNRVGTPVRANEKNVIHGEGFGKLFFGEPLGRWLPMMANGLALICLLSRDTNRDCHADCHRIALASETK